MHYDNERESMSNQTAVKAENFNSFFERRTLIDLVIDATGGKWPSEAPRCRTQKTIITRTEFESRKAERRGKPDWSKAPAWANWLAQDSDGIWCWYEPEPEAGYSAFKYPCQSLRFEMVHSVRKGEVIGSWQDALEQRSEGKGDPQVTRRSYAKEHKAAFDRFADGVCAELFGTGSTLRGVGASAHKQFEPGSTKQSPAGYSEFEQLAIAINPALEGRILALKLQAALKEIEEPEPAKAEQDWGLDPDDESGFDFEALANQFDNTDDANAVWALRDKLLQKKRKSPELSFHLANASNELQASVKLLDAESHLLQSITGVIGAIQAIREAV